MKKVFVQGQAVARGHNSVEGITRLHHAAGISLAMLQPADTKVISRRTIHKGKKFDFEMVTAIRDGGRTLEREVVRHPGAVTIVPVLDDGRVVLIRNRRIAVDAWLYEFPAGTLDPAEGPETCARRELIEETGYEASQMTPLGWFYTTPGLTDEKMHAFVATGLRLVGQKLEEDEQIEVEAVAVERVLRMIDAGEIVDAKTILSLLQAQRRGLTAGAGSSTGNGTERV